MDWQPYVTALLVGLGIGAAYALVALAYNLVFSVSGVFNFAQGDLVAWSGLITYTLVVVHNWSPWIAVGPVVLAIVVLAVLQERTTVAPVLKRRIRSHAWFVTTLGASMILQTTAQMVWGSQALNVPSYIDRPPLYILGSPVPWSYVIILATAVMAAGSLEFLSGHTRVGKMWRAAAEDPEAAQVRGINVRALGILSFILAAIISGVAGFVTVPVTLALFNTGALLSLKGFVAIVLGGFGSHKGALIGGILLGIVESEAVLMWDPGYRNMVALLVLITVLMVRPTGIFGYATEREV